MGHPSPHANTRLRIGFWEDVPKASLLNGLISELSANEVKALQQEAMTKTYGQRGMFWMKNGGAFIYVVKSHSLTVKKLCEWEPLVSNNSYY